MQYFWQNPAGTRSKNCGCLLPNDHTMADVGRLQFILDELDAVFEQSLPIESVRGGPAVRNRFRKLLNDLEREVKHLRSTARR